MEKKIEEFLFDYEDLWYKIVEFGVSLPIMDIVLELIEEDNYYGCDFTNDKKMLQLFFTGQSNYFPAFWVGEDNYEKNLDMFPIYVIDICSEQPVELIGNFKNYMTIILTEYLKENVDEDAERALKDLVIFSDKIIKKPEFKLINNIS